MINVTVTRYNGDKPGDDIIEPLLGSINAAIARGQTELDRKAQPKRIVTATDLPDPSVRCGMIVEVSEGGRLWRGKIVNVSFRINEPSDEFMELEIERYESPTA